MALTLVDYALFTHLVEQQILPARPRLLELGEANWYGDVTLEQLADDIRARVADPVRQQLLLAQLRPLEPPPTYTFDLVKIFYEVFLRPQERVAVDWQGTPTAHKYDLNRPLPLPHGHFDLVLNLGTGEHIFHVPQFFQSVHDLCAPNGWMLHLMPFQGWPDHGFYGFQPTFFFDLAAANYYHVQLVAFAELTPPHLQLCSQREQVTQLLCDNCLGKNVLIYALLRQSPQPRTFRVPVQGYYAGVLSQEGNDAWHTLR